MYLEELKYWRSDDWNKFFAQYPLIKSQEQKDKIKQTLSLSSKEAVESFFWLFRKYGIINGIGPGYIGAVVRWIISFLFKGVKAGWHDIRYGIGGIEADRIKADYGLFKYSIITMIDNFRVILKMEFSPLALLFIIPGMILASILQFVIIVFCFIMVLVFGRFGSFRYL